MNDRLSQLPDDILLTILSYLSVKEAARTSLVSQTWKNLWRYSHRILIFEDLGAMDKICRDKPCATSSFLRWVNHRRSLRMKPDIKDDDEIVGQERTRFTRWVNHVVEKHMVSEIDEFRVTFNLEYNNSQSHVDKWVLFALAKQVKRLELDFTPSINCGFCFSHEFCVLRHDHLPHTLTSLCLRYVNVSAGLVDRILQCCPVLEHLCIEHSKQLNSIRSTSGSSLSFKHLEICHCPSLKTIDIYAAPKLLSFRYIGDFIELHIGDAWLLSKVSVGGFAYHEIAAYAFDSLSKYFSQLEYLSLNVCVLFSMEKLEISRFLALTNLKHLELCVVSYQTLLGCTTLIKASPVLEKLTFKMCSHSTAITRGMLEHDGDGCLLKCLKTLELVGFLGHSIDLEFVTYVFKNANMLEEIVVVDAKPEEEDVGGLLVELEKKLPQGVKLIFKPLS